MRKFLRVWAFVGTQFIVSLPSFAQWEPDKQITNYPTYHDYGSYNNAWTIAVQDSLVHIVWEHRMSTIGELYYVQSTNSGRTFGPHQQLTTQDSHYPSICVFDSFVHIAWHDARNGNDEIYYNRSSDYGVNWDIDNFRLTNGSISWYLSICCSDSYVHIAWMDIRDGNWEIYYNRSSDYGATWDIDNFRLTNDDSSSRFPSICCSDSFVHIVWTDFRDNNQEIYYNRSSDYGATWDIDNFRLTTDAAISWVPSICCSDSFVHIAWHDERDGNREIYYNRSIDYGVTWDINNFRLTNDVDWSEYPSICCSDSCVHVGWRDFRDSNWEIYYNRSGNYGETWGGDERLTNAAGLSGHVSVACWNCDYDYDVHVAWTDERDGNEEIYYKRHKCPGSGIEENKELRVESLELRVFPNPSLGNALIKYRLPEKADISLGLYDISGRLAKTLYSGTQEKGYYTINVGTRHGMSLPRGIYFIKLDIGDYKATKKLTILK